jgi:hypothetical protein
MRPHHKKQSRLKFRASLASLAAVVLVCRALIPGGYMPAPLAEGGPVVLCHSGLAGAFVRALSEAQTANAHTHAADHSAGTSHEHQHSEDEPDTSHDAWEHCPVGAAFSAAPLSQEFALSLPEPDHELGQAEPAAVVRTVFSSPYRARAPPAVSSRQA